MLLRTLGCFLTLSAMFTAPNVLADDTTALTAAYERGMQEYKAEKFSPALQSFSQALALAPKVFGPGKNGPIELNTATLNELVGLCQLELLDLAQAEARFLQCIRVGELEEPAPSPLALRCKNNLAELYQRLHQFGRSEQLFREVLRDQPDRKEWGNSASNLAYVLLMQDRLDEAAQWFSAAKETFGNLDGAEGSLKQALLTHGQGMIAHKQGRTAEAERLFRRALAARQQHLPAAHRFVAHSQGMLAATLASQGRDRDAEPLLQAAERAMRAFWGGEHLDVAMELHELGLLSERLGDTRQALARLNESRRILRNYQLRTLRLVPEDVQLRFLAEERSRFQDVIAIARRRANDPAMVHASLEWVLNEKGLAHEALADRQLVARSLALDPKRQTVVKELNQVRQELVALAGRGKSAPPEKAAAASRREAALLARLGLPENETRAAWFTVEQVQAALAKDAALVEIVRLEREAPVRSVFDARPKPDAREAHYLAWILKGADSDVALLDLGPAHEIDAALKQIREAIAADTTAEGRLRTEGEAVATVALEKQLADLSRRILQPLAPSLRGVDHLIISPDSALWLVPWAALPLELDGESKLLVERLAVRYEISGRNLLRPPSASAATGPAVVFADPTYDLARSESSVALSQVLTDPARRPPVETRSASLRDLSELPRFTPLAHSAVEAEAIVPHLQQLLGQAPLLYHKRFALEGIAKAMHRPGVVSFITHGFFLPEADTSHGSGSANPLANPLLRCGLALAGCNAERGDASVDDGILTGLEVVGLDLRGTKLAVLSACDTGVGQVNTGEGVAGLRQAFQLAGASAVASTLWEIPDRDSALVMDQFFRSLAERESTSAALRQAQLERIAQRREKFGAAHPLFWAAWTITGQ